jgi:hypothetical protein
MIENIRLYIFVVGPLRIAAEHINLNSQPLARRGKLSYQKSHLFINLRVLP